MHRIEGDFLGAESCIDLRADMEDIGQVVGGGVRRKERVKVAVKKDYPPPLPWLVRTESLPTTQMPWVMKRSYTEDGRLIITEEMSDRYEYFRVHRSDTRLRMDLVRPFWNQDQEPPPPAAVASDEGGLVEPAPDDVVVVGSEDDGGSGGGSGGNKCSGSLVFGVAAVPALHPVRT